MRAQQLSLLLIVCTLATLAVTAHARPDSDVPPLPGPGLSYGKLLGVCTTPAPSNGWPMNHEIRGIPYGSMSGNVAEFFKRQAASVGGRAQLAYPTEVDFAPIEQWL